ncbi:MAG: flavodoxin family protein [Chloroflexi bacterium]|nr:flavodoxin family protein [Chloroflexota bacterium]
MKALVIYDTFFSNTEKVAQAVGKGLGTDKEVSVVKVDAVKPEMLQGLDFMIVGSPTRAFSPSPASKTFIKNLSANQLAGVKVTTFDTRLPINEKTPGILRFLAGIFGYADKPLLNELKKKGGLQVVPSEGFMVSDSEGPLAEGELERATEWGKTIRKLA